MPETDFLDLAIQKAREGILAGQMPYGAVIVRGGIVVAGDHNKVRALKDPSAHAEVVAIRRACLTLETTDLSDCAIYCTCEPCLMCFGACYWAKLPVITYGAGIDDKEAFGLVDPGVRSEMLQKASNAGVRLVGGVRREECRQLFRLFNEQEALAGSGAG